MHKEFQREIEGRRGIKDREVGEGVLAPRGSGVGWWFYSFVGKKTPLLRPPFLMFFCCHEEEDE